MEIVNLNEKNMDLALDLYNQSIIDGEILYKPMNIENFKEFFLDENEDFKKISIMEKNGNAFASGSFKDNKGYITLIIVKKDSRRKGLGTKILNKLEEEIKKLGDIKEFDIIFFNPMNLSWIVPDTKGHDHPNSPGIDVSSMAYIFFKNNGYRDKAYQNSYYIDLKNYEQPLEIIKLKEELKNKGITFEVYDKNKHIDMKELFDILDNPLWIRDVYGESIKDNPRPILVPIKDNKVGGFTGPLDVEESGRGYFAGIAVHPDFRGQGVAKVLFSELCINFKNMDAKFMTLFTGENNPARNIYEAAGFKIVRTWADMKKEI